MISCIHGRNLWHIVLGEILLCLILYPLLSWGCIICDTCSVPLMFLCTIRLLHASPTMRGNLVYYELLFLSQVGLRVCGWNQIIQRCEYRLICGKGLLIYFSGLDWFLSAVIICTIVEDDLFCLSYTVPLRNYFEGLYHSLHIVCSIIAWGALTDTWCLCKLLSSSKL